MHLVDTDGHGVERITPAGVVVAGAEYPVDCIIYASGFEVGTETTRRYGFDLAGRDGAKLSQAWSDGMRSMHGVHVHGFPNAFHVQLWQGGNVVANVPHNLTDSARTVAAVVSHMAEHGYDVVEVTKQAEDAWMEQVRPNPVMSSFLADCTPGYYNNEGQDPGPRGRFNVGYPQGAMAYFQYIDQWQRVRRLRGSRLRLNGGWIGRGPSGADRRAHMMLGIWEHCTNPEAETLPGKGHAMSRPSRVAAFTGALLAVMLLPAATAAAAASTATPSLSVSPSSGLRIGQIVTVTGSNLPSDIYLAECAHAATSGYRLRQPRLRRRCRRWFDPYADGGHPAPPWLEGA